MEESLSSHPFFPCSSNKLSSKKGLLRLMLSTFTASKGKNGMLFSLSFLPNSTSKPVVRLGRKPRREVLMPRKKGNSASELESQPVDPSSLTFSPLPLGPLRNSKWKRCGMGK